MLLLPRTVEHSHADGSEDEQLEEQDRGDVADVVEDVRGDRDAQVADVDVAGRPSGEHRLTGAAPPDPLGEDEEGGTDDECGTAGGEERGVEDQPEVGLGDRDIEQSRGAGVEDELRDDLLAVGSENAGAAEDEPDQNDSGDDGETFEYGQHGLLGVLASCVWDGECQSGMDWISLGRSRSVRLGDVGDDIGRRCADRAHGEHGRPGTDLLRQRV